MISIYYIPCEILTFIATRILKLNTYLDSSKKTFNRLVNDNGHLLNLCRRKTIANFYYLQLILYSEIYFLYDIIIALKPISNNNNDNNEISKIRFSKINA